MITYTLALTIVALLNIIFGWLPEAGIADIPYIGQSLYDTLVTAITTWNTFLDTFPYAEIVWLSFKIILAFEAGLLLLKFFLGHRTPAQLN